MEIHRRALAASEPASAVYVAATAPPLTRPVTTPHPPTGSQKTQRCALRVPQIAETEARTGQGRDWSKYTGSVGQPLLPSAAPDRTAPPQGRRLTCKHAYNEPCEGVAPNPQTKPLSRWKQTDRLTRGRPLPATSLSPELTSPASQDHAEKET